MRRIKVPEQVVVRGVPVTYETFVRHLLDTDDRFTRTGPGIRMAMRIELGIKPGAPYHHIEQTDWEIFDKIVEAPTAGYVELISRNPEGEITQKLPLGRKVLPFVEAVHAAEEIEVQTAPNGTTTADKSA